MAWGDAVVVNVKPWMLNSELPVLKPHKNDHNP